MADEDGADALIGRTDALLKRHRPRPSFAGSPAPSLDIPVLTEIVEPDAVRWPGPPVDVGDGTLAQVDIEALALRLHEDVLRSLQPQIESLLDARLAQTLADLLEQVLHGMEAELKVSLRAIVRDAVAAAIDREVLRITSPQRGSGSEPAS